MTDEYPDCDAGRVVEQYRGYLRLLADLQLDADIRRRLDASDIVQRAMLKANEGFAELRNSAPAVVKAWLRQILTNELTDAIRFHHRDRRDINRERSIAAEIDQSAAGLEAWMTDDHTSPSRQAVRNEETLRLADALLKLPDATREVVILKHLKNLTLKEITEQTGRSNASIAGLLRRGLATLRELLNDV